MDEPRSDARGDDADIPPSPGQDRPAGPGAESMAPPQDDVPMAPPSEMAGAGDDARTDDTPGGRDRPDGPAPS